MGPHGSRASIRYSRTRFVNDAATDAEQQLQYGDLPVNPVERGV
jgi:hypothetical protein